MYGTNRFMRRFNWTMICTAAFALNMETKTWEKWKTDDPKFHWLEILGTVSKLGWKLTVYEAICNEDSF